MQYWQKNQRHSVKLLKWDPAEDVLIELTFSAYIFLIKCPLKCKLISAKNTSLFMFGSGNCISSLGLCHLDLEEMLCAVWYTVFVIPFCWVPCCIFALVQCRLICTVRLARIFANHVLQAENAILANHMMTSVCLSIYQDQCKNSCDASTIR